MAESLELVRLPGLMALSQGSPDVEVAIVDGPVVDGHPDLHSEGIREIAATSAFCHDPASAACRHGTFVAGILKAKRGGSAPAICPGCGLLVRPIFAEQVTGDDPMAASMRDVADAIVECVDAGARVINLSAATPAPTTRNEPELDDALSHAARRGVLVVAAAGNQAALGSSALTRHVGVIPVVAYDARAVPMHRSNLGIVVGKRGVGAPGEGIKSLECDGRPVTLEGTSFAAPFVTGTIALLWSLFPRATAAEINYALRAGAARWLRSVVPPMLDAWGACRSLAQLTGSSPAAEER
jgi:subtilisin family serine protease